MSPSKNTIKVKVETDDKIDAVVEPKVKTRAKVKSKVKPKIKKTTVKKPVKTKKRKTPIKKKSVADQKIVVVDEDTEENIEEIKEKAATVTTALGQTSDFVKKAINKEKENEEIIPIRANHSVTMYRRIAFSFIALTLALLVVVMYFLLVKVTVIIVPNQERISNNIIFDVKAPENIISGGNVVPGLVEKSSFDLEANYLASGENIIGKEAVGEVEIINNYNRNQPLVATTRLLAASGELFRLKNTVNVPAGESMMVEVYADDPSPDMAIKATSFTIPGLWAGLQDKIFAKSKESILYKQKVEKYILESDLDGAVRDLKQKLLVKAKEDIESKYEEYKEVKYKIDENSIKTKIEVETGDKIDEFTASITADIVVVAFDEKIASDLAKQKFIASLSPNKEVIEFNNMDIIYALNNYDYLAKEATLNATFEGKVSIRDNAEIIDVEKIKGLNQAQLDIFLKQIKDIAGHEIIFTPSFLPNFLKRVPKLSDRIEIMIRKK